MDDNEQFEQFMEKVLKRPLPQNPMARVRTLAKELAEGAADGVWLDHFERISHSYSAEESRYYAEIVAMLYRTETSENNSYHKFLFEEYKLSSASEVEKIIQYFKIKWNQEPPNLSLLVRNQYLESTDQALFISKLAFDLLDETEPTSIFISYKRSESSAFAMFVLTRLKMEGLEAFVDMSLTRGENWHAGLEERIKEYDYLIALIGQETLKSDVCLKEIKWAIEAGLGIIPVWHNGFKYKSGEWDIPIEIDKALGSTHAIQVKEESASGYNAAMAEMLSRFGITP